jgi:hypothetical protein
MYRQGDILFVSGSIPDKAEQAESRVVAYGEATGHSHRLEGDATVLNAPQGMFVRAGTDAAIVHDEHATIQLPEGEYRVIRQREFDEGAIRYVSD